MAADCALRAGTACLGSSKELFAGGLIVFRWLDGALLAP